MKRFNTFKEIAKLYDKGEFGKLDEMGVLTEPYIYVSQEEMEWYKNNLLKSPFLYGINEPSMPENEYSFRGHKLKVKDDAK